MKTVLPILCSIFIAAFESHAAIILDDVWADGNRANQSLPSDSAWFCSSAASLTAGPGSMSLTVGSGSVMAVTYFGTNSSSPVQLEVGDTLITALTLTFSGVGPLNTSAGFKLGVFNFADSSLSPKWLTADTFSTSSQGAGVQGYSLFQNMGATFNNASPMDIRKRTNLAGTGLLSSSGDHTSLGTGPGSTNGFSGFSNGTPYVLQISLQRTAAAALEITMSWLNTSNGATLVTSATDASATNFSFDGIALRPAGNTSTASTIRFSEVKVELIPGATPPSISLQPQDREVFAGQNAAFAMAANGTPPLNYQWFSASGAVEHATNSTLVLINVQPLNAGDYFVVVTNASGSITSEPAHLTVTLPVSPSILTQPQDQLVSPGGNAQFSVTAGGSEPLMFQWYFNTNTLLLNATEPVLVLTNVQPANAGSYSVVVSNFAGNAASAAAALTINTNPIAPQFVTQPASVVALTGTMIQFTVQAAGTAPISYQWKKGAAPVAGATNATLVLSNVRLSDAGNYSATASNVVGVATSAPAVLTVTPGIPVVYSAYNLQGFGHATTGGGVIAENDPAYRKVYNALDLANAILSANKTAGSVKVIEIMNDLDLGWNEVGSDVQTLGSSPFRAHAAPKLHPRLLTTGVSLIDIKSRSGLTIFSTNGATIRHACFNIKSTANIIVRNLKFDELWEWDEASKGNYDGNDWDFIDLGNGGTVSNVWVDHCTFTKAYDGIADIKGGSYAVTFSWCKYAGDDGATNTNSWVRQQINYLEQSPASYPMYNFLRTHGFSVEDIVTIAQGHDKTHLIGANSLNSENAQHSVTFHHDWFINVWDRLPRLRAGNVHNFNIYVDDTLGLAARRLRDARAAVLSSADQSTLNNTYSFKPFLNGTISTENGAILVEKSFYRDCLTPLRNNQTDPSNPIYTGKVMALDTIYRMDNAVVRGNSTDPGNPLGPFQAPVIAFSWNLPGNQLPYTYAMDDPSQLEAIVTSATAGAGAGVLTWPKTNWLMTTYAPTAPVIVADPQTQTVAPGESVTLTVVAGGSAPLRYQWFFNTNQPIANATNPALVLTNVQAIDAGAYSVFLTNSAGSVSSAPATLIVSAQSGFEQWQAQQFSTEQLLDSTLSGPDATPAHDGVPNLIKYALGLPALAPATGSLVSLRPPGSDGALEYHRPVAAGDVTYRVEVSTNLTGWSDGGVSQQMIGTDEQGREVWRGSFTGPAGVQRFFRLLLIH